VGSGAAATLLIAADDNTDRLRSEASRALHVVVHSDGPGFWHAQDAE
jgi:hypothetical protein